MSTLDKTANTFGEFIARERGRYTDDDNNRFAFSAGQPARYLHFLEVVEGRYETANDALVGAFRRLIAGPSGIRRLTPEEEREVRQRWRLQLELHLEIESFLVFAKTLLDKIAHFVEDYFGPARRLSLRSHDQWCKNAAAYAHAKGLDLPAEMTDTMLELRTKISDFRDKMIAHLQNPRVAHATTITADGLTAIGYGFLNPKGSDRVASEATPIPDLAQLIDRYVAQLTVLIEQNRSRTRLGMDG